MLLSREKQIDSQGRVLSQNNVQNTRAILITKRGLKSWGNFALIACRESQTSCRKGIAYVCLIRTLWRAVLCFQLLSPDSSLTASRNFLTSKVARAWLIMQIGSKIQPGENKFAGGCSELWHNSVCCYRKSNYITRDALPLCIMCMRVCV